MYNINILAKLMINDLKFPWPRVSCFKHVFRGKNIRIVGRWPEHASPLRETFILWLRLTQWGAWDDSTESLVYVVTWLVTWLSLSHPRMWSLYSGRYILQKF